MHKWCQEQFWQLSECPVLCLDQGCWGWSRHRRGMLQMLHCVALGTAGQPADLHGLLTLQGGSQVILALLGDARSCYESGAVGTSCHSAARTAIRATQKTTGNESVAWMSASLQE